MELSPDLELFLTEGMKIQDPKLKREVAKCITIRDFPRQSILVHQGEIPTNVYLLIRGVARGFIQGSRAQEVTQCFIWRCGEPAMPGSGLCEPAPSHIEALTECRVACLPVPAVERLTGEYKAMQRVYESFLCHAAQTHLEAHGALCRFDAMGRYHWFLQNYPGLVDVVPGKYVASFLNITPVTLSRVRRKLRENSLHQIPCFEGRIVCGAGANGQLSREGVVSNG